MAVHHNPATMAVEAIDEYLEASTLCFNRTKAGGGVLGYPGTLLLFCVVNALGTYLESDKVLIEGSRCRLRDNPFRVLNHQCFGLSLKRKEVDLLQDSHRNKLAHNAIVKVGASLVPEEGKDPFIFSSEKRAQINVFSFHRLVREAWERFPRERIEDWARQHPEQTGFAY